MEAFPAVVKRKDIPGTTYLQSNRRAEGDIQLSFAVAGIVFFNSAQNLSPFLPVVVHSAQQGEDFVKGMGKTNAHPDPVTAVAVLGGPTGGDGLIDGNQMHRPDNRTSQRTEPGEYSVIGQFAYPSMKCFQARATLR